MKFYRATLTTCARTSVTGVVIDVLRAFSTAAYAFSAGARDILLIRNVEEAITLRRRFPDSPIMGEVGGLPVQSFDFSNSPAQMAGNNGSLRFRQARQARGKLAYPGESQAKHCAPEIGAQCLLRHFTALRPVITNHYGKIDASAWIKEMADAIWIDFH